MVYIGSGLGSNIALILFTLILTGSLLLITQAGTRWLGLKVNTATTAFASCEKLLCRCFGI